MSSRGDGEAQGDPAGRVHLASRGLRWLLRCESLAQEVLTLGLGVGLLAWEWDSASAGWLFEVMMSVGVFIMVGPSIVAIRLCGNGSPFLLAPILALLIAVVIAVRICIEGLPGYGLLALVLYYLARCLFTARSEPECAEVRTEGPPPAPLFM